MLAVFTQPDRPKGRGGQLSASPVKEAALRLGIAGAPTRAHSACRSRRAVEADAAGRDGGGGLWPDHSAGHHRYSRTRHYQCTWSLLPKYRGAAPIQWAIANGETRTGVTTMRIDAGLDTGDMLLKWETEIGSEEMRWNLGLVSLRPALSFWWTRSATIPLR